MRGLRIYFFTDEFSLKACPLEPYLLIKLILFPRHRKRKWGSTAAVGKKGDGDEVIEGKSAALKRSASHAIDSGMPYAEDVMGVTS